MVLLSRLGEWLVCYKMAAVLRTLNVLFPCDALIRLPFVVGSCGRFLLLTLKLSLVSRTSEESQRAEPVWHAGSRRWPSVSSGTPLTQASRAAFRRHSFVRAANLKQQCAATQVTPCRLRFSVSVISIVLVFTVREEWPSFESIKQRDFYSRHRSQESLRRHCLLLVHNLSPWRQATPSQEKSELDSGALARLRLFHTQLTSTTAR